MLLERKEHEMKYITDYKEFDSSAQKSILTHVSKEEHPQKQKILAYMKAGKDDGIRCSHVHDYIEDENVMLTVRLYTDGEYSWTSEEIYHFEKYNLELNEDFVKKVFEK